MTTCGKSVPGGRTAKSQGPGAETGSMHSKNTESHWVGFPGRSSEARGRRRWSEGQRADAVGSEGRGAKLLLQGALSPSGQPTAGFALPTELKGPPKARVTIPAQLLTSSSPGSGSLLHTPGQGWQTCLTRSCPQPLAQPRAQPNVAPASGSLCSDQASGTPSHSASPLGPGALRPHAILTEWPSTCSRVPPLPPWP